MDNLERQKIINYFNYNITLEHSAIIQYLFHAYTLGDEAGIEDDLEEIAREEMKHLRMFAHKVVELGGEPAISDRAAVFLHAPTPSELLNLDVEAEKMAIEEYSKQYDDLKDESAKRILERVVNDENSHHHLFLELKEKLTEKEIKGEPSPLDENRIKIVQMLNQTLERQYKLILENLYQSFITRHKNPYLSDELEQKAIDKMKHYGWVAEEVAEMGGEPEVKLPEIDKVKDEKIIIQKNLEEEKESPKVYEKLAKEVEDPDLQWILKRIQKREIHYTDLAKFLEKPDIPAEDVARVISTLTVGSLFRKKDK